MKSLLLIAKSISQAILIILLDNDQCNGCHTNYTVLVKSISQVISLILIPGSAFNLKSMTEKCFLFISFPVVV